MSRANYIRCFWSGKCEEEKELHVFFVLCYVSILPALLHLVFSWRSKFGVVWVLLTVGASVSMLIGFLATPPSCEFYNFFSFFLIIGVLLEECRLISSRLLPLLPVCTKYFGGSSGV